MLYVDAQRMRTHFDALSAIGATPDGGVHRPALSEAHLEACRWFQRCARAAGLETRVDGAGNHFARLRCGPPGAPALLLGSHLDSVPYGGRFDGALGVVAALEALQVVRERGLALGADLEAVAFTDEEGYFVGLLGSEALAGRLRREHLRNPRAGRAAFEAALDRAGLTEDGLLSAGRDPRSLAGYLELHVEQGPRLVEAGLPIGVVTSIVGMRLFQLTFSGRANHAGTTPMARRLDAGQGAAAFILAARELVMRDFPGAVANVGRVAFEPGAFNVVPRRATLALEFRAADAARLDEIETALLERAAAEAARFGLSVEAEPLERIAPVPTHDSTRAALVDASRALGLAHTLLPSGASHDAQSLAPLCPVGMVFVPSVDGLSHAAGEFSRWEDCVDGANVLLNAALSMAMAGEG